MNEFAKELRRHRERTRKSVRDAADEAGVSAATFNRVENGGMPSIECFVLLKDWLGEYTETALTMLLTKRNRKK